jgi:hypothetical protein
MRNFHLSVVSVCEADYNWSVWLSSCEVRVENLHIYLEENRDCECTFWDKRREDHTTSRIALLTSTFVRTVSDPMKTVVVKLASERLVLCRLKYFGNMRLSNSSLRCTRNAVPSDPHDTTYVNPLYVRLPRP